jgi:hypothetical protein
MWMILGIKSRDKQNLKVKTYIELKEILPAPTLTREIGKESRQGRGKITYIRMYSKPKMNLEINYLRRYLYRKANRQMMLYIFFSAKPQQNCDKLSEKHL